MPAVSNSSPLIFYAVVGKLDLLHETYGEILIPPAVWQEAVASASGIDRPGADDIRRAPWIRRHPPVYRDVSSPLLAGLDAGEAEAIVLAISVQPRVPIILDDLSARRAAERMGLAVTGSAGVLVQAKSLGLIERVGPILAELRTAGLYLSEAAAKKALENANEHYLWTGSHAYAGCLPGHSSDSVQKRTPWAANSMRRIGDPSPIPRLWTHPTW
jgi:predicted nucleic acid-binding protein